MSKEQQKPDGRQPYEAPHLAVIGTFAELTKKLTTSNDGHGGHQSG